MNYLNLSIDVLDRADVRRLDNDVIGLWVRLSSYCYRHETEGVIKDAEAWTLEDWLVSGFKVKSLPEESELWSFEGGDLHVKHYPAEWERSHKAKREAARTNGKKGGRPRTKEPSENPTLNPKETQPSPQKKPSENPKVREGKGKEKKSKEKVAAVVSCFEEELRKFKREEHQITILSAAYIRLLEHRTTKRLPVNAEIARRDAGRCCGYRTQRKKVSPPLPSPSVEMLVEFMEECIRRETWQDWYFDERVKQWCADYEDRGHFLEPSTWDDPFGNGSLSNDERSPFY